ncbi:hypothetical protein EIQ27_04890 [Xanthomonas campestris pv. armoraciae]
MLRYGGSCKKKTPSSLKLFVDKRARLAGQISQIQREVDWKNIEGLAAQPNSLRPRRACDDRGYAQSYPDPLTLMERVPERRRHECNEMTMSCTTLCRSVPWSLYADPIG